MPKNILPILLLVPFLIDDQIKPEPKKTNQLMAWYTFSAFGFYSVCPATNQYVIGAPLFKKATLTFENGKQFVIQEPENSQENKYAQKLSLSLYQISKL